MKTLGSEETVHVDTFLSFNKNPEYLRELHLHKLTLQLQKLRQQLAEKAGTSQSVMARLESGRDSRTAPLPFLARLAACCNATFEFGFRYNKK